MVRSFCLLVLLCCLAQSEETLQDVIKRTDMGNADAVFTLAEWCAEHNKPTTARQYYGKCLEIDKDHEAARARLGQVKIGDRWVASGQAPPGAKTGDKGVNGAPATVARGGAGPGPAAKDVAWELTVASASGDSGFVDNQIERMNRAKNDSDEMDSAVLTLLRADCRPQLLPRLSAALMRADFNDIYGACQITLKLLKEGHRGTARKLLPFIAKCSEHVTDADDLETFAYVGPLLRDRRLLPRLIELMDHANPAVKKAATGGVAALTLLPAGDLTPAKAKAWWDQNWNVPEHQVLMEQLRSSDPKVSVEAAKGLYELRERLIVPALTKLLKSDDHQVVNDAIMVITKITGNDWGFATDLPADKKTAIIASLDKWWKENQNRFEWIEDRNAKPEADANAANAKPADPNLLLVQQLSSVEGKQSEGAQASLLGKGKEAVPALIAGLRDKSTLIRSKCNDLLKTISKQDFKFDAHGDEGKLAAAIEAWRKWALSQKIVLEPGEDEAGDAAPAGK
jgi:hypothetical protein